VCGAAEENGLIEIGSVKAGQVLARAVLEREDRVGDVNPVGLWQGPRIIT
jgi:hypothetical protein